MLVLWPLGLLPYEGALVAWLGATIALFLVSASFWLQDDSKKLLLVALALAPASLINIFVGQTGFLTAALLLSGLWFLKRQPVLSGIAFALLTFKPQLGLLIPVLVLAGGHWRVFMTAVLGTALLIATSIAVFGHQIWLEFLTLGSEQQLWILTEGQGIFTLMMPTVFMGARLIGFGSDYAMAIQLLCSLVTVVAVYRLARHCGDEKHLACFMVLATVLASPYAFNYDMTAVSLAVLLVLISETWGKVGGLWRGLWIAIWMLPLIVFVCNAIPLPIAPVLLGIGLWYLWSNFAVKTASGASVQPRTRAS